MKNLAIILAFFVYYISVVICFTILSIVFHNFWLMLLAILFFDISIKAKDKEA